LAENTSSTISQISILFTASSAGYFLGSVFGGRLYDRQAGHPIMAALLVLMAVVLVLIPYIPLLWLLTVILFMLGVFGGILDVGGNTLLIWVHRRNVSPYMNALHFFFGVGTFIAPIILAQTVLLSGDIELGYIIMALMILPIFVWVLCQPSPTAAQDDPQNEDAPARHTRTQVILIIFTAAILFFYVGAEIGFGGWIYTYALELNLADETTAAYLNSAFWGAFTVGRLLSIPLATRFRPRILMIVNFVGCVISAGLIILLPDSVIILWTGSILMGLSMASIFPVTITLAERRMTISGQTTSWFFVGVGLGSMLMPLLIGQLFESVGPLATMYVILAALVADFVVFLGMLRFGRQIKVI
jgi:FHS family Na+ dependent glucose MFS transporter 1